MRKKYIIALILEQLSKINFIVTANDSCYIIEGLKRIDIDLENLIIIINKRDKKITRKIISNYDYWELNAQDLIIEEVFIILTIIDKMEIELNEDRE